MDISRLVAAASIAGGACAVAGIAFGLYQYHQNTVAAQAKEALEYVKRYYETPILTSNVRNTKYWQDNHVLEQQTKLADSAYEKYLVEIYTDKRSDLSGDVDILVGFFEDLHACICNYLCDSLLVKHFFTDAAWTLKGQMGPYINSRRTEEPRFGDGLFQLAKAHEVNSDLIKVSCIGGP